MASSPQEVYNRRLQKDKQAISELEKHIETELESKYTGSPVTLKLSGSDFIIAQVLSAYRLKSWKVTHMKDNDYKFEENSYTDRYDRGYSNQWDDR